MNRWLLSKAFLRAAAFPVVLERAGFPVAREVEVGGDILGQGRDVHVAEPVVERGHVLGIADRRVGFPVREYVAEVAQRGGVLGGIGVRVEQRQRACAGDFRGLIPAERGERLAVGDGPAKLGVAGSGVMMSTKSGRSASSISRQSG